jgi:hypothetical protein
MSEDELKPELKAELKAKIDILVGKQEQEEGAYEAYKKIKDERRLAHDYILELMDSLQRTSCSSIEHGKKVNIINKKRKVGPKTVDFLDIVEERYGQAERKLVEQEAKRRCVASEPKKTIKITRLTDAPVPVAAPKARAKAKGAAAAKPQRYNEESSDSD